MQILMPIVAHVTIWVSWKYLDGLVQDCSNSIANALELLQSCTKPSIYTYCGLCDQTPATVGHMHVLGHLGRPIAMLYYSI